MADSQDIFMLLLIILFMANNDTDTASINSTILMLLLFGSIRNANSVDTVSQGCQTSRIAATGACRCCNG